MLGLSVSKIAELMGLTEEEVDFSSPVFKIKWDTYWKDMESQFNNQFFDNIWIVENQEIELALEKTHHKEFIFDMNKDGMPQMVPVFSRSTDATNPIIKEIDKQGYMITSIYWNQYYYTSKYDLRIWAISIGISILNILVSVGASMAVRAAWAARNGIIQVNSISNYVSVVLDKTVGRAFLDEIVGELITEQLIQLVARGVFDAFGWDFEITLPGFLEGTFITEDYLIEQIGEWVAGGFEASQAAFNTPAQIAQKLQELESVSSNIVDITHPTEVTPQATPVSNDVKIAQQGTKTRNDLGTLMRDMHRLSFQIGLLQQQQSKNLIAKIFRTNTFEAIWGQAKIPKSMTRAHVRDQILTTIQNIKSHSETGEVTIEQLLKDETLLKALGIDSSKQSLELWGWNKQGQFTLLDMNSQQNVEEWLSQQKIILAVDPVLEGNSLIDFRYEASKMGIRDEHVVDNLIKRFNKMPDFLRDGILQKHYYRDAIKLLVKLTDKQIKTMFNKDLIKKMLREERNQLKYNLPFSDRLVRIQDFGSIVSNLDDIISGLINIFPSSFEDWGLYNPNFVNQDSFNLDGEDVYFALRTMDPNTKHSNGFFNKHFRKSDGNINKAKWDAFLNLVGPELEAVIIGKKNERAGDYDAQFDFWTRNYETHCELLGLEYIIEKYLKLQNTYDYNKEGVIMLTTEKIPCKSCDAMIKLFKLMFPNIILIVNYVWDTNHFPDLDNNSEDFDGNSGRINPDSDLYDMDPLIY